MRVFAANMTRARRARNMPLAALARAAQMSPGKVSGIEQGRREPTEEDKQRLSEALRVPVAALDQPYDPAADPADPAAILAPAAVPVPGRDDRLPIAAAAIGSATDPRRVLWEAIDELRRVAAVAARGRGNDPSVVYAVAAARVATVTRSVAEHDAAGKFRNGNLACPLR